MPAMNYPVLNLTHLQLLHKQCIPFLERVQCISYHNGPDLQSVASSLWGVLLLFWSGNTPYSTSRHLVAYPTLVCDSTRDKLWCTHRSRLNLYYQRKRNGKSELVGNTKEDDT